MTSLHQAQFVLKKTFIKVKKILKVFGPGVITGAADDDPSGIATYTQTGYIRIVQTMALQKICESCNFFQKLYNI